MEGRLSIDYLHHPRRIALPRHRPLGQRMLDSVQIFLNQSDVASADVLFEASYATGPGDGNDVLVAVEQPCQRKLSGRAMFLLRELLQAVRNGTICGELLSLKTRIASPPVVLREIMDAAKPSTEKSTTQRTVRHQRDTQFTQYWQQAIFGLAAEQRVLALDRCNWMNPVSTAYCLRRSFRQSEVAHLSCVHQLRHRADRLFDRHPRIDAMQIVEIDVLHSQPL